MTKGRSTPHACGAVVLCAVLTSFLTAGCGSDDFVSLPPPGTLLVTVTTSGSNVDPDGYQVGVTGPGLNVTVSIGVDDTATFSIFEAGTYTVQLAQVAANCSVDENPRAVVMALDTTSTVTFAVTCS
jgi:hypothetical protein